MCQMETILAEAGTFGAASKSQSYVEKTEWINTLTPESSFPTSDLLFEQTQSEAWEQGRP